MKALSLPHHGNCKGCIVGNLAVVEVTCRLLTQVALYRLLGLMSSGVFLGCLVRKPSTAL